MKRAQIQIAVQLTLTVIGIALIWGGKSDEGFTCLVGAAVIMAFRERAE